jgi:hypothetical protein
VQALSQERIRGAALHARDHDCSLWDNCVRTCFGTDDHAGSGNSRTSRAIYKVRISLMGKPIFSAAF